MCVESSFYLNSSVIFKILVPKSVWKDEQEKVLDDLRNQVIIFSIGEKHKKLKFNIKSMLNIKENFMKPYPTSILKNSVFKIELDKSILNINRYNSHLNNMGKTKTHFIIAILFYSLLTTTKCSTVLQAF